MGKFRGATRFAVVAVFALVTGVLTGCGPGDAEPGETGVSSGLVSSTPTVSVTPSASATPTPSPSPTIDTVRPEIDIPVPTKYPEMANDDIDGADAAARYFLDLFGYTYQTGRIRAWEAISATECDFCQDVRHKVSDLYGSGGWVVGNVLKHEDSVVYFPTEDENFYLVVIHVEASGYEVFNSTGDIIASGPPTVYKEFSIGVRHLASDEWEVVESLAVRSN